MQQDSIESELILLQRYPFSSFLIFREEDPPQIRLIQPDPCTEFTDHLLLTAVYYMYSDEPTLVLDKMNDLLQPRLGDVSVEKHKDDRFFEQHFPHDQAILISWLPVDKASPNHEEHAPTVKTHPVYRALIRSDYRNSASILCAMFAVTLTFAHFREWLLDEFNQRYQFEDDE